MNTAPVPPLSAETPGPSRLLSPGGAGGGNSITLLIPGQPFAKQRPRFSRASGRAYTPGETVKFERVVQQLAAIRIPQPLEGPLAVSIYATFVPPASWSKRKVEVTLHRPHTQRPDLDNIGKAILDGLNRIAWADDAQVADLHVRKVWGITPQTVVIIRKIGPNDGL
jgi:Holliday junction resolvase RusA-like endonuclease